MVTLHCVPDDVLSAIFSQWINLNDVRQTDTAFCSHQLRNSFLNSLKVQRFSLTKENGLHSSSPAINWLGLREFYCETLSLENFHPDQMNEIGNLIRNASKISVHDTFSSWKDTDIFVTNILKSVTLMGVNLSTALCSNFIDQNIVTNNLENLRMSHVTVSNIFFSLIAQHCSKLQNISFHYCDKLTDEAFELIVKLCRNIAEIDLYQCQKVTTMAIKSIEQHAHNLTSIIYMFSNPTEVFFSPLLSKCLKLQKIRPTGKISGSLCGDLWPNQILQLKEIDVGCCGGLEQADFAQLLCHCPYLEVLRILQTELFGEEIAIQLSKTCHNLCHLSSLFNSFHCPMKALLLLFKSCSKIARLEISSDYGWDDTIMCAIAPYLSNLLTLRVLQDKNLSDKTLVAISKYCLKLNNLTMLSCPQITYKGVCRLTNILSSTLLRVIVDISIREKEILRQNFPHIEF